MRRPVNRLTSLFRQYLAGTLNAEDRRSFLDMVAEDRSEQELKELIDQEIAELEPGASLAGNHLSNEQADLIFEHIVQARPVIPMGQKRLRWIGAAAAVLLAAIAGFYFLAAPPAAPAVAAVSQPAQHDVAPGTAGAILTLANGQTILLDSLGNGNIATEGAVSITKENNGIAYRQGSGKEAVYNTLRTPRARQFRLVLPDGTRVWLNAASSITYPTAFTGSKRVVTVTGETYFEVTEDKKHPFIVQYGNKSIEVLGTHFNVNAYEEERDSRVTLLQGAVTVRNGNGIRFLKPGQQAILASSAGGIRIDHEVDTDEVMAWKDGHFDFRATDLRSLMRQLMRWYDVDVIYEAGVPERYFTADISRDKNLLSVLKILELNNIHFTVENRNIIVTP